MDVSPDALVSVLDVLRLKVQSRLVGVRYDKKIQPQRQEGNDGCGKYVWNHHPMETHTAGKYSNDFGVGCHLGRKEYDRNEHEQRTEHVDEVRHEVHVVVKDDRPQRRFLGHEVIDLLADVEDDDDADDKKQRHEEGSHELLYDI